MRFNLRFGLLLLVFCGCTLTAESIPTPIPEVVQPSPTSGISINPAALQTQASDAISDSQLQPLQAPVSVNSAEDCLIPTSWVIYEVQNGDSLGAIAQAYNTTVDDLAQVNCLEDPDNIFVGQTLYVPSGGPDPAFSAQSAGCQPGVVGNEVIANWEGGPCIGVSPFVSYDQGIIRLEPGATVRLRWIDPPDDVVSAVFTVNSPTNNQVFRTVADTNPADGIAVSWTVPPGSNSGRMGGEATLSDGSKSFTVAVPVMWGN